MGDFRQEVNSYNQLRRTRVLDLDFTTEAGQGAPTTLTVATAVDDPTITVADDASFGTGQFFGIFGGDPDVPQFYFGTVWEAPVANVLKVDSQLDSVFGIGSVVLPLSKNMAVDGSVTPVTFSVQAGGATSNIMVDVARIMMVMETPGAVDLNKFGSGAPLTKGILFRRKNGVVENIWNVKTNRDFVKLTFDYDPYVASNPSQGIDGLSVRNTYAGEDKHGSTLGLEPGDSLEMIVRDNLLTRTTIFETMGQGHVRPPK